MPSKQFLISGTSDAPHPSDTEYSTLLGDGNISWSANEPTREAIISTPGKLSNFKVGVKTAPGDGKSWTFTVRKNNANTALSVTISGSNTISSLDTDEVTVAAGDKVCIRCVPSGNPTLAGAVYWTCQFTPDTAGETILLSNTAGNNLASGYYNTLIAAKPPDDIEFDASTLFPTAGALKKFYVALSAAPGGTSSRTFTIRKNGVATSLVVTISGANTTGNNTSDTVSIAPGDRLSIRLTQSGAPFESFAKFGITFLPNTPGEYIASATTDNPTSSIAIWYQQLNCGVSLLTATENEMHNLAQATKVKAIYVNLSTAPGAGNSWIFTLRDDLADTALAVTISGTNKNGNYATDVQIAADSLLDTSIDARAGVATSKTQIAYLLYNPASSKQPGLPPGLIELLD